ncbi:MAG: zinc-ribbon domain-containing protein, partial [SAR202 cluster bacterium]|nr:zinc-ribbon domain-containing protein [SAR202 cluster bacterium]
MIQFIASSWPRNRINMDCPACSKQNTENDQFCRECGTSLGMPANNNGEVPRDTSARYHG